MNMNSQMFNNSNTNNKKEIHENDNNKKLIVSLLGLAILIVAIIGISFAFFKADFISKNSNTISTKVVTVDFVESNSFINLKNAIPVSDNTGKNSNDNNFDFVVTTTPTENLRIPYDINIIVDENNTLDDSYVKFLLLKNNEEIVGPKLISDLPFSSNRENSRILYSTEDIFESKDMKKKTTYTLKLWLDSNFKVENNNSKTYKLKVNVDFVKDKN